MRKTNSKGKIGKVIICPKCRYKWRTRQANKPYVCCSNCKRYFKILR